MRALLLLLLVACQAPGEPVSVVLSVTPANKTRPCLISKVAVFDDAGTEYRAGVPDCNDAVIELAPGRTFSGFEFLSDQAEAVTVYLLSP